MNELVIKGSNGDYVTTSLIVAQVFGKRHADILRVFRELACSDNFRERNFAFMVEISKLPQGGSQRSEYYEMTKDGFCFLVMGFTGKKAAAFKEKFIDEFNKRDALLRSDDYILERARQIRMSRGEVLEGTPHQSINTRDIAEITGRRHSSIVNDVRRILRQDADKSDFTYFEFRTISGVAKPSYELTRRGCMLLASSYVNARLRGLIFTIADNLLVQYKELPSMSSAVEDAPSHCPQSSSDSVEYLLMKCMDKDRRIAELEELLGSCRQVKKGRTQRNRV